MGNVSAADMFALQERKHLSLFSGKEEKQTNKTTARMIAGAVMAGSVMLATQLEASEGEEETASSPDEIKTSSLGHPSQAQNSSDYNVVEAILGSAVEEFETASLTKSNFSGTIQGSGSVQSSVGVSENGLPRDFVTNSPGVSDPSQSVANAGFSAQTNNTQSSAVPSQLPPSVAAIRGENGEDGLNGTDGINGLDGEDGADGINGINGVDGTDGIDGSDGINGIDGTDGEDGIDGINGVDGIDGADGEDGLDGLTTIYLDPSLFEGTDALSILALNGFDVLAGPLGSIAITFEADRSEALLELVGSINAPSEDEELLVSQTPDHDHVTLTGTDSDDILFGSEANNVISGFGGNDNLTGGAGADTLLGGDGLDTADYRLSEEAVHLDLATSQALFGDAEGDILVSIEHLAGSAGDDILIGDDLDNRLTGRNGDDILSGGNGNDRLVGGEGADHFDGGAGNRDAADYNLALEAVGIDLLNGGFMGEALGDTFTGIEFIVGSAFHDILLANDDANRINGGDGCDILHGRDGNDTLIGESGDDVLNGGEGNDVFIFDTDNGYDIIEDFEAGEGRTDRVSLLDHSFEDFDDIQSALHDTQDGVLLELDTGSILFQDITSAELHFDDFILA